jgi:death on curing protein
LAAVAAAYGYGIARIHPFIDGDRRAGIFCSDLFLSLNGMRLHADQDNANSNIPAPQSGLISGISLADWIRDHCGRA